jgi:hypothetical protein
MSRSTLAFPQRVKIHDRLKEALYPVGANCFAYRDALSDDAIAKEMPFPCTQSNVAGIRREMFGRFPDSGSENPELAARVARLETVVGILCERLGVAVLREPEP